MTRITCETSTIIDRISYLIINSAEKISQFEIVDSGISNHQIILCTRKIKRIKNREQKCINFRSLKNYSAEAFLDALKDLDFPNYEDFNHIDNAYSNFVLKVSRVIDDLAPSKQSRIKNNNQEWFGGEIKEKILTF